MPKGVKYNYEILLPRDQVYIKENKKAEIMPLFNNYLKIILKNLVYSRTFRVLAIHNVKSNKGSATPGVDDIKFYKEKAIRLTYTGSKISIEGESNIGVKYEEFTFNSFF